MNVKIHEGCIVSKNTFRKGAPEFSALFRLPVSCSQFVRVSRYAMISFPIAKQLVKLRLFGGGGRHVALR
jgi:hypothetical protein